MAQKANILTFDDVITRRSSNRPSSSSSKKGGARSNSARSTTKKSQSSSARTSAKKSTSQKSQKSPSASGRSSKATAQSQKKASSSKEDSRAAKAKRERNKQKAGKAFTKQFGGEPSSSQASSGGSRAALYKGEMGTKHKKAAKMQNASKGSSRRSKNIAMGSNPSSRRPKLAGALVVVTCLVLACGFLFPTAKQYYVVSREHDQLQAELQAVTERNNQIQAEVDALQTDEGIEDKARSEFGWVKAGETGVNVYGLESVTDTSNYNKSIQPGSVPAPETWYSPILDKVFGLE